MSLFILFGWGKQTKKYLSEKEFELCRYCHKSKLRLVEITFWVTLFFIPIIPYKVKYCLSCNNCEAGYEIDKEIVEKLEDKSEEDRGY